MTLANYATTVRRHIGPRIGSVPLRTLTTARVEGMYADLAAGGSSRGGGLAPKSVHNVHQVLHRSLAAAVRNDLIARNQADGAHSLIGRSSAGSMHRYHSHETQGPPQSDPMTSPERLTYWYFSGYPAAACCRVAHA